MEFPLPQVQAALKPYIHPPSEALYIRQVVTQHIANLSREKRITDGVGSEDEFRRFLDYEVGRKDAIRKEYLEALRENTEARRGLEEEEEGEEENEEGDDGIAEEVAGGGGGGGGWIEEYLDTLKLTRQFERLEILQIYLRTFNDPAVLEAESTYKISFTDAPPAPPAELTSANPTSAVVAGPLSQEVHNLVLKLEKQILAARSTLLSEQSRTAAAAASATPTRGRGNRKEAFARTRDALIAWVESQLSHTSPDPPTDPSTTNPPLLLEDVVRGINAAYAEYLAAREELVEVLSWAPDVSEYNPITTTATDPPSQPQPLPRRSLTSSSPPPPLNAAFRIPAIPPPEILKVLGAIEELAPLLKAQKAFLSQRTHFAAALANEHKTLLGVLEEFAASAGSPAPGAGAFGGGGGKTAAASVQIARAIADKECAAMEKFSKDVDGNVSSAKKALDGVQDMLADVERMAVKKKKKEDDTRIPTRKKGRRKGDEGSETEVEKGLWGMLGGGVGVIGDGI